MLVLITPASMLNPFISCIFPNGFSCIWVSNNLCGDVHVVFLFILMLFIYLFIYSFSFLNSALQFQIQPTAGFWVGFLRSVTWNSRPQWWFAVEIASLECFGELQIGSWRCRVWSFSGPLFCLDHMFLVTTTYNYPLKMLSTDPSILFLPPIPLLNLTTATENWHKMFRKSGHYGR